VQSLSAGCRAARGRTREIGIAVCRRKSRAACGRHGDSSFACRAASSLIDEDRWSARSRAYRSRVQIVRLMRPGDAESWLQRGLGLVQIEAGTAPATIMRFWHSWQTRPKDFAEAGTTVGKLAFFESTATGVA